MLAEADKAIAALNGTELGGRALKINEAQPKTDSPRGGGAAGGGKRFGGGGVADAGAMTIRDTHASRANRAGRLVGLLVAAGVAGVRAGTASNNIKEEL